MKPLAITCGDPAGVGPEIVAAWLNAHPEQASEVAVLGHGGWLETLPAAVSKIAVVEPGFAAVPGQPSEAGARIALGAMERAAAGCWAGEFSGVVTGPVSKDWLARIGYEFPGQTEFFAARWGGVPTMAFCGGTLRVVLLTWHIPFREVPSRLTRDEFSRAVRAADELARAEGIAVPRIGVCGLNPHAGEAGLIGREEREIIDPLLDELRREFPGLSRAEPSDTLFHRQARGEFDVTVALYHDQGLAPLKLVDFDTAVNVTLGLPFVRTSPDHGTAFGIAGKGKASATSFSNAVEVARRLIARRAS
ncbi:MAG: 4-hydroxythreonine-4-phosphate dehydrogenase 1 [Verrucomicrobia bacterium ADurb.Bin122]|nr:MAG: 4-hydroxythreonine-4-phosphate dehydrogenase 1 [Verrucomicrobia bacterium ADurb.Bin122]